MVVISGDSEDTEGLRNELKQTQETVSNYESIFKNVETENEKLRDTVDYYKGKFSELNDVLKRGTTQHEKSQNISAPNYNPRIGRRQDKVFKVGSSYPVTFENGAKYEWKIDGKGAEKVDESVRIKSKESFTIVVMDNGTEVNKREVSKDKIVE